MTDTLTELKRLHAEFIEACGPFQPYSYLVPPNEMALFALRNAFETAAAVEIPKLLACIDEAAFLVERLTEFGNDGDTKTDDGERDWHGHVAPSLSRLSAALASLKGGA